MAVSISGKEVEVLSELFFCYYFALKAVKKLNTKNGYDPREWSQIKSKKAVLDFTKKYNIASSVSEQNSDPEFTLERIKKADMFLNEKGWHDRLVQQIETFYSKLKIGTKKYEIMRADVIPAGIDPYRVFGVLSQKAKVAVGLTRPPDKDKWNPADVWIFSSAAKTQLKKFLAKAATEANDAIYSAGAVSKINEKIFSLFESKDLFPVSLKAPGAAVRISEENNLTSNLQKMVTFKGIELGATNQDVKLKFKVDMVNKKTKRVSKDFKPIEGYLKSKTDRGGFRLEIEITSSKAGARYGSIGTGNYQWIIKNTADGGIKKLENIRSKKFPKLDGIAKPTDPNWLSASKLQSIYKKDKENSMKPYQKYLNELYGLFNNIKFKPKENVEILNKTIASEIAVAIDFIKNKFLKDITIENLYNLSASQKFGTGARPDQLALRKLTKKDKQEIEVLGAKEAQLVFQSCFHLKVY
jgi:hypothetical protein